MCARKGTEGSNPSLSATASPKGEASSARQGSSGSARRFASRSEATNPSLSATASPEREARLTPFAESWKFRHGELSEWPKEPDSKSGIRQKRIEGSNPSLSAIFRESGGGSKLSF